MANVEYRHFVVYPYEIKRGAKMITTKPKEGEIVFTPVFTIDDNEHEMVHALVYHDKYCETLFIHGLLYESSSACLKASQRLSKASKWHFLREQAIELAKKENGYTERQGGFYAVWDEFNGAIVIQYSPMHYNLPVLLWPSKELLFNAISVLGLDNYKKYILGMEDGE